MSKTYLKEKQKKWDEWYDSKKWNNCICKYNKPVEEDIDRTNFIMESHLQLMEESLSKTKFNSVEFNTILKEYIELYLNYNKNDLQESSKEQLIKSVKEKYFKNEVEKVGEFNNKELEKKSSWPTSGRITLREAIKKSSNGQMNFDNKKVNDIFAGTKKPDNQPSPSN